MSQIQGGGTVAASEIRIEDFQAAFGNVAASVAIVTTLVAGRPHGTTVTAFTSLSANPPLLMVALDQRSDLLATMQPGSAFGVNVLSHEQAGIAMACARKGPDKLRDVRWTERHDTVFIESAAAWFACAVESIAPGGDHMIVVGAIADVVTSGAAPLVYHRRRFTTAQSAA
jgi:flavin reductase (DIM6/NTAB) family NADH-FMN oxidoreductase RutF